MAPVKLAFYARVALILHGLALTLLFMYLGRTIFIPLFFAFLAAMLLLPLVKWLEKKRLPRALASTISIIFFMVIIGGMIYFFSRQVVKFTKDLPNLEQKFSEKLQSIQTWISNRFHIDDEMQVSYINKSAGGVVNPVVNSLATTFVGIIQFFILTIFFFVFSFFMLYHRRLLNRFLLSLFSASHAQQVTKVILKIRTIINSYVLGLLTEMAVLIVLIFTVLSILGIKYALLMSVLAAVLNIIPYLGIYTALFVSLLITLANGTSSQLVEIVVVFLLAHFLFFQELSEAE